LQAASFRQKELYDEKIHGKPYNVSDFMWLHNPAVPKGQAHKLYCPWTGPFKIVKKLSSLVYRVQNTRGKRRRKAIHFNRLKPYVARGTPPRDKTVVNPAMNGPKQPTPNRTQPPGITLHLVDEADEVYSDQYQASTQDSELTLTVTSPTVPGRQYPVRTGRHRPLRYCDGAMEAEDWLT